MKQMHIVVFMLIIFFHCNLYGQKYGHIFQRCDCKKEVIYSSIAISKDSMGKRGCFTPIYEDINIDLSDLNHLIGIDFSHENNFFVDTLDFGGLTNVRYLGLPVIDSVHFFSLQQFKGVENLNRLRTLSISGFIDRGIPFDFSGLTSLKRLDVYFWDGFDIDSIQSQVGQLKKLKILDLTGGVHRLQPDHIPAWLFEIKHTNKRIKRVIFSGYIEWPEEEIEEFRKKTGVKTTVPKSWMIHKTPKFSGPIWWLRRKFYPDLYDFQDSQD
jgi:hypothetical protein